LLTTATSGELFSGLPLFNFICLQWLERPENSQTDHYGRPESWSDWKAGINRKPCSDRKARKTGKPEWPEWSLPTYCPNEVTCININTGDPNWNSCLKGYFLDFFTEFGSMDN
jgi:hypothetical protein